MQLKSGKNYEQGKLEEPGQKLWNIPAGHTVTSLSPNTPSAAYYRDTNHQLDTPSVSGSGLVNQFQIKGDTNGDDVDHCTEDDMYMNVIFNEIEIRYRESH